MCVYLVAYTKGLNLEFERPKDKPIRAMASGKAGKAGKADKILPEVKVEFAAVATELQQFGSIPMESLDKCSAQPLHTRLYAHVAL